MSPEDWEVHRQAAGGSALTASPVLGLALGGSVAVALGSSEDLVCRAGIPGATAPWDAEQAFHGANLGFSQRCLPTKTHIKYTYV